MFPRQPAGRNPIRSPSQVWPGEIQFNCVQHLHLDAGQLSEWCNSLQQRLCTIIRAHTCVLRARSTSNKAQIKHHLHLYASLLHSSVGRCSANATLLGTLLDLYKALLRCRSSMKSIRARYRMSSTFLRAFGSHAASCTSFSSLLRFR